MKRFLLFLLVMLLPITGKAVTYANYYVTNADPVISITTSNAVFNMNSNNYVGSFTGDATALSNYLASQISGLVLTNNLSSNVVFFSDANMGVLNGNFLVPYRSTTDNQWIPYIFTNIPSAGSLFHAATAGTFDFTTMLLWDKNSGTLTVPKVVATNYTGNAAGLTNLPGTSVASYLNSAVLGTNGAVGDVLVYNGTHAAWQTPTNVVGGGATNIYESAFQTGGGILATTNGFLYEDIQIDPAFFGTAAYSNAAAFAPSGIIIRTNWPSAMDILTESYFAVPSSPAIVYDQWAAVFCTNHLGDWGLGFFDTLNTNLDAYIGPRGISVASGLYAASASFLDNVVVLDGSFIANGNGSQFIGNGGGLSNAVDLIPGNNIQIQTNANKRSFTITTGAGTTNVVTTADTVNVTGTSGLNLLALGPASTILTTVHSVSTLNMGTNGTVQFYGTNFQFFGPIRSTTAFFTGNVVVSNNAAGSPAVVIGTNGNVTAVSITTPTFNVNTLNATNLVFANTNWVPTHPTLTEFQGVIRFSNGIPHSISMIGGSYVTNRMSP